MKPLPDFLRPGLDLVLIGINPGMRSAAAGHHYAGPGNHFWPLLYESEMVSEPLTGLEDARVLEWGIGLTNMVDRASPGLADLSVDELRTGGARLRKKLVRYQPRVACFNGKKIYEIFAGRACKMGVQRERVGGTQLYVMPSTSPRGASYSRAEKLAFFVELRDIVRAGSRAEAS